MDKYERYKNDLQELEDCFAAIKQNTNVNQNLKLVNRILIRMFGEQLENHLLEYLTSNYHLEKTFENSSGDIYVYRINASGN